MSGLVAGGVPAVGAKGGCGDRDEECAPGLRRVARIYWIGGSFGGVGKSLVAMAVLDCLLGSGRPTVLVEADSQVPDVWKAYHERLSTECLDLRKAEGWINLINACGEQPDAAFVVNTPPGMSPAVRKYGTMLDGALEELRREVVGLWAVDRRGVGEGLQEFMESMPRAVAHVVLNAYRGGTSPGFGERAAGAAGEALVLPRLADEVTDALYSRRLSIDRALGELSPGARSELVRWRRETRRGLGRLIR
jgi:hypothetical protein